MSQVDSEKSKMSKFLMNFDVLTNFLFEIKNIGKIKASKIPDYISRFASRFLERNLQFLWYKFSSEWPKIGEKLKNFNISTSLQSFLSTCFWLQIF